MTDRSTYDIITGEENQAAPKEAFGFQAVISEQTSDEIGQ